MNNAGKKQNFTKKFLIQVILFALVSAVFLTACATREPGITTAVYLGVEGYGHVDFRDAENFEHRFDVDGAEVSFKILSSDYSVQNTLIEGEVYDLAVQDGKLVKASPSVSYAEGVIVPSKNTDFYAIAGRKIPPDARISKIEKKPGGAFVLKGIPEPGQYAKAYDKSGKTVFLLPEAFSYEAPVKGEPGKRTLKNFLATALEPVGVTLYIYGGGWNWQDTGAGREAVSIGLSQTWLDFFYDKGATYTYRNNSDPAKSYYPNGSFNEYSHEGLDCSGYVGWLVYNVMHKTSGKEGYVQRAAGMAKSLAEDHGFGVFKRENKDFRPGDIFSMKGHIWVCLGVCEDGSIVIVHAVPSKSRSGQPGGGVQLSGIGKDKNCEAYQLAKEYMERYYPEWSQRYEASFFTFDAYTKMADKDAGTFSWYLDGRGLADPDNFINLSVYEIIEDLFRGV